MKAVQPEPERGSPLEDASVSEGRIRGALVLSGVLISLAMVASFGYSQWRTERLLERQLLVQARAFAQEVVATRRYVAEHGGVYVRLREGVRPNPYLDGIPGLKTRVTDASGTAYVLQNPSLVTRMVSEQLSSMPGSGVSFRLASDSPVNPDNQADAFEAEALGLFAAGASEHSMLEGRGDSSRFRYASAMPVEKDCLQCHEARGWREGEIRGALSVSVNAGDVRQAVVSGRLLTALFLAGGLVTLLLALRAISRGVLRSLLEAERGLRHMASHDMLTGLVNRREALRRLHEEEARADRAGRPVAIAMLDLDHFKRVNDTAGHHAGDAVLAAAAEGMLGSARSYDLVARVGGEEFLLLMPGLTTDEAIGAVERVRAGIAAATVALPDAVGPVTASAGVAVWSPGTGELIGDALRRADQALYQAKADGRDRSNLA